VPATSSSTSIYIYWVASTTAGVTYQLEESTTGAFAGEQQLAYSGTASTVTLTNRLNNTYYYRVKAVKTGMSDSLYNSNGVRSCVVSATVNRPGTLTVPATNTNGNIYIYWVASTTPGATHHLEESATGAFAGEQTEVFTGATNVVTLPGRTTGIYYYRVNATKAGMNDSLFNTNGVRSCVVTRP
jgi:hypothetical protein